MKADFVQQTVTCAIRLMPSVPSVCINTEGRYRRLCSQLESPGSGADTMNANVPTMQVMPKSCTNPRASMIHA